MSRVRYRDPRRPIVLHVAQWPGAVPLDGPPGETSWFLGVPQPVWAGWYDLTHDCPPMAGWPPWPDGTVITARKVVGTPQTGSRRRVRRGCPILRLRVRHLGGGRWLVEPADEQTKLETRR